MPIVSENGLLDDEEYKAYKSRSVNLKFNAQLFGGFAGATFFALLTQVGGALLKANGFAALATINPIAAVGFLVVGAVCTYMAQKYYFESSTLDSDFNVRKMGLAVRGPSLEIEEAKAKGTSILPPGMPAAVAPDVNADKEQPRTSITAERALADTIVARGAANENTPITDKENASWETKLAAEHAAEASNEKVRA